MANIFDTAVSEYNVDKYLDFLAKAEGDPDYNTIVGGGKFSDYSKHPGVVGVTTKEGPSTAAGRWQITKTTYDDVAPKVGVTDFSPDSQKKIAVKLLEDNNALEDVQKGDWDAANAKLGKVWASLPSSPYKQPKKSQEWVKETLKATMDADNAAHKADTAQPLQVLDRPGSVDMSGSTSTPQESENIFDKVVAEASTSDNYFDNLIAGKPTKTKTSSYPGYVPFEGAKWENIDTVKAFAKAAGASGAKAIAASPAMTTGAELLGTAGTITGGPIGGVAGSIIGGVGGLIAGEKAVEKLYDEFAPEKFKEFTGYDTKTREKEIAEHPVATRRGELAGNAVLFRPGFLKPIELASGKKIGTWTQRALLGGAGGLFEAGSELASGEKLDPQAIKEAAMFTAVSAKPTALTTHAERLAANIMTKLKLPTFEKAMSKATEAKPKPQEEFTLPNEPMPDEPLGKADIEARQGRMFTAEEEAAIPEKDRPIKALLKAGQDIVKNIRESSIWKSAIEQRVPDVRNREHITLALEQHKPYDHLITEEQRRQKLYGDSDEVIAQKEERAAKREAKGLPKSIADRVDRGMKGALDTYKYILGEIDKGAIDGYNARIAAKENPKDFKGFDKFWHNYKNTKGFPKNGTVEEQAKFFKKHHDNLDYVYNKLEARPFDPPATFKMLDDIKREFKRLDIINRIEGLYEKTRQNYVTHALNFKNSVLTPKQQLSLSDWLFNNTKGSRFTRDFSQGRAYRYIRDLEEALRTAGGALGLDTRGVVVEKDIAKIMQIYKDAMGKAQIESRLVNYLLKTKLPTSKVQGGLKELPILTKDPKIAFDNNYVPFEGPGSEALKGVKVHPDFVDPLGFMFQQKDPLAILEAMNSISMLSKTLATTASMFHATSLLVAKSTAAPDLMLKEVFTKGAGSRQALKEFEHNGASKTVKEALDSGLGIKSEDVQLDSVNNMGSTIDRFVNEYFINPFTKEAKDVKLVRNLTDPLQEHFLSKLNRFTWEYMHTAGKLQLWQHFYTNIKAKHPELPDQQVAEEVSKFVNNTLGGLNWLQIANDTQNKVLKDVLFKLLKKQNRKWSNVILFAPDWTVSTLRSFTQALPRELMKPKNWELREGVKGVIDPKNANDLARRYVLFTMVGYATLYNAINLAFTGRPIWTNEDPTRLDLNDGTTMQLAKHSMESLHWLLHPVKTGINKLGYIPKVIVNVASPYTNTAGQVAKAIVEPFIPFQVSAAVKAPVGERLKRAAASFVGTPIYGQTKKQFTTPDVLIERKLNRAESAAENKLRKTEGK